jgi:hypothetical protein
MEKTMIDVEGVFIEAGPMLTGALAIAREGLDDIDGEAGDHISRLGAIVDLLERYQEATKEAFEGKAV